MFKNKNWVFGEGDLMLPGNLNFSDFILKKVWQSRDRICFINGETEESFKYGEVAQRAMNIAVSLYQLGVRKGQMVAICSENRREYFPALIGSICTGAVVTTINVGYTTGELQHVINIGKPSYIFCSPNAYKNYEKVLNKQSFIKKIFIFGDEKPRNSIVILYNDISMARKDGFLKENVQYEEFMPVEVKGSDTVFVLYSSGTTGLSKGVVLTNINALSSCSMPNSFDPNELAFSVGPWYHVMGLVGSLTAFVYGRSMVYLPKFEVQLFLRCLEKYKISQVAVVPPIIVAMCKAEIKYDLSSVRIMYCGAAPLHKDTLDVFKAKFPNITVLQGYGMTELSLAIKDQKATAHLAKPGGVGFVSPGTIVKIADTESRKALGPNQPGEICVKSSLVMKGYLGVKAAEVFDDEGFFKTGDIGYYDDDRYFFIVDRLKELIKYKGYQVPPAEIEALLIQHPGVKDAGVVGVRHEEGGEAPLAFVVRQTGSDVTEEEIKKFVAERLSNPKHLRGGVRFCDEIPKNPSGKILRRNLRALLTSDGKSKL